MPIPTRLRRALAPEDSALTYLLRATFNAANQGYANGQVLDTVAEGVQDGQLTVVEVDGTLAIVSNKCALTPNTTPAWGDQGFYSQAITRNLGLTLLSTISKTALAVHSAGPAWFDAQAVSWSDAVAGCNIYITTSLAVWYGSGNPVDTGGIFAVNTDYTIALVLGGYDSGGVPWRSGEPTASYLYGSSVYLKGGSYATWTLIWKDSGLNTATLHAGLAAYNAAGTIDNFRVPDKSLSAVLQPTCLSTFTAANGTSLDAITPEVGGAWTEDVAEIDIQSNKANAVAADKIATVSSGISDCIVDATLLSTSVADGGPAIVLRYTDSTHHWLAQMNNKQNETRLWELDGGSTERASTAVAIATSAEYDMRAICDGEQIDVFIDGGNKISYGSATVNKAVTVHGINLRNTNDTADNFAVFARTSSTFDDEFDAV